MSKRPAPSSNKGVVLLKRSNARCSWSRTFERWIVRDGAQELGSGEFSHDAWHRARKALDGGA
jgi:hypothetical protein